MEDNTLQRMARKGPPEQDLSDEKKLEVYLGKDGHSRQGKLQMQRP